MNINMKKSVLLLTGLGSGLEYYDFMIYAIFAHYISHSFFPSNDHYASLMATFGVFAVSYLLRPIGGVIFGILGDRYGRKPMVIISINLMAISTFGMACTPSYASWGIAAPLIFTFFRMLQGIALGAELPGALTFLIEHLNQAKQRGLHCGMFVMFISIGASFGALMGYVMPTLTSVTQLYEWGWRVPFLVGGTIAIVAYLLRRNTQETPSFKTTDQRKTNALSDLLVNQPKRLIAGCCLLLFPATWIAFGLSLPTLLPSMAHFPLTNFSLYNTLSFIWATVLLPFMGYLSDIIGRRRLLLIGTGSAIILLLFLPTIMASEQQLSLLVFLFCYQSTVAMLAGCYFASLTENFPVAVRYTGIAFCYNTIYAIAGFIPGLSNTIYHFHHQVIHLAGFFILLATITFVYVASSQSDN